METGPRLKVSFDRLEKPGIESATPGLQGKWLIHYTTAAPMIFQLIKLFAHTFLIIFIPIFELKHTYVLGVQKNRLIETVLSSTHIICVC